MTTNIPKWSSLLTDAANELNIKVHSFCIERNEKESPRYFHADVVDTSQPSTKWRMKIVNSSRDDFTEIQNCNSYNNSVHARSIKAKALRKIVRIPEYFDLPVKFLKQYNLSEFIRGTQPSIDNFELIVDVLTRVQLNRGDILRQLKEPNAMAPRDLHEPNYKDRLKGSLSGLANDVDTEQILSAFEARFPEKLPDVLTFAHGDFSFGNLMLADNTIALIDFEHSHVGLGCVDMAHLYVNLFANGEAEAATVLRNLYMTKFLRQNLWFQDNVFEAMVIERATGKMNSMKDRAGENFKRLNLLLDSYS